MLIMYLKNVRVLVNNTSGFRVFLFGGNFSLSHEIIFETLGEMVFFSQNSAIWRNQQIETLSGLLPLNHYAKRKKQTQVGAINH